MVKEMVMDQRARPSDRTKTPEEIAQEEKERLEKLEVCSIVYFYNEFSHCCSYLKLAFSYTCVRLR